MIYLFAINWIAFIQQVNAQTQNNRLTLEQSNQLKQAAQSIQNSLGCS